MRARWRPTFLLPLIGAGLGLVGCGVGASEPIIIAGCTEVRSGPSGPRCALDFSRGPTEIRLLLRVPIEEHVRVLRGGNLVEGGAMLLPSGETRLRINVNKGATSLWLLVGRSGGLRRLPLQPLVEAPWLAAARADWYRNEQDKAIATLNQHLYSASPEEKARALGMMGLIHNELNDDDKARDELRSSLTGLREAGLVSAELMSAFYLATLLRDTYRDVKAAEVVLQERILLIDHQPEMKSWFYFHDALNREAQGQLREALRLVEEGQLIAWHFGDTMSLGNFEGARRRLLRALGRADEVPEDDTARNRSACWQAFTDAERGYSKLLQREARLGGARPAGAPDKAPDKDDPRPQLMQALKTVDKECINDGLRLSVLMHLARLDLLEGKIDQAAARLAVIQASKAKAHALQLELKALEGELALAQLAEPGADRAALLQHARQAFDELARLAPTDDENESGWRALLGQARVSASAGELTEAKRSFVAAEAYLNERAKQLPLGAGRGSFLGRHERGTSYYLAFLYEQGDLRTALQVARWARVRGLLPLAGLAAVDTLPAFQAKRFTEKLQLHAAAREELDAATRALAFAPIEWRPWYEGQQRLAHLKVTGALEEVIKVLPDPPAQAAPRVDEALLICHPLPAGDPLCLLQDQVGIAAARPSLVEPQALLAPFKERLAQVRRLRVLPAAFREIDIHQLVLPKGIEVVYALDIPAPAGARSPAAFSAARTAGLFADPTNQILPLDMKRLASKVTGALAGHGFKTTTLLGSGVDRSPNTASRAASASPWLSMITDPWQLLLYLGHSEQGSWNGRIGRAQSLELWIGDILLARPPGPLLAYMVTCFGAQDREDSGDGEALSLGTAQLLRPGAGVLIAPSRQISTEVSVAVLEALGERDPQAVLDAPAAELRAALVTARTALSAMEKPVPELERELAAFRVYVR